MVLQRFQAMILYLGRVGRVGRVAVAWTSATVLDPNDATGGYAVFGCTP